MPKLRAQLKATAGRGKPPRPSPVAAPATPAANTRFSGAAETTAEKAAGKRHVVGPATSKTAEASANDAARFIAVKQDAEDEMGESRGASSAKSGPR